MLLAHGVGLACPSSQCFLSITAATLIRTWNAIRVFSGRMVTGPQSRTISAKRR